MDYFLSWLSQDAISLGHYAEAFHQQRIYTLGQLSEVFQRDFNNNCYYSLF
uniref:AraC family transcriptional regulator n=1 Tax=Heterorhabditis bacteriophora TaxID=37862 RepID=A0A1I7WNA0_HETBA